MANEGVSVEVAASVLDLLIFEWSAKPLQMDLITHTAVQARLEPARRIAASSPDGALRRAFNDGAKWGFYQGTGVAKKVPFDPNTDYPVEIDLDEVARYLIDLAKTAIPDRSKKVPKRLINALINRAWATGVIMGFGQANRQKAIGRRIEKAEDTRDAHWTSRYSSSLFESEYGGKSKSYGYHPRPADEDLTEAFIEMLESEEEAA